MSNVPNPSPGFMELMAENRRLCDQLGDLRAELARLVGYHEKDGSIPVEKIEALLGGDGDE